MSNRFHAADVGDTAASGDREAWEDLAALDPLWAVLAVSGRRFGRWDRDGFLQTGKETVAGVLRTGARFGVPEGHGTALDFGCGAGRLTLAISEHFDACLGLDISEQMLGKAREHTRDRVNCCFAVHDGNDLLELQTGTFDLVLSYLVLQHVPPAAAKASLIAELVRVLRPGGLLAFQLPSQLALWRRVQVGPRLYSLLRRAGVSRRVLYADLRLHPIRMSFVARSRVLDIIQAAGGRVLDVRDLRAANGVISTEYFVTKDAPLTTCGA
jgi:SAM-dependent methyltransferase